jgi:hypothetical protein
MGFDIARSGHKNALLELEESGHVNYVEGVWMCLLICNFLFMVFTGVMLA